MNKIILTLFFGYSIT